MSYLLQNIGGIIFCLSVGAGFAVFGLPDEKDKDHDF